MMTASDLKNKKERRTVPKSDHPVPVNKKSWLETLPVELLEHIFLHSLEPNMALASPFLCRTLSKESIYRVLILFAFFADDGEHPVVEKYFAPAVYRALYSGEQLRLQKRVLDSRWCTFARFERCLPALKRLSTVQKWYSSRKSECDAQRNLSFQDVHDQQQKQRVSRLPPLDDVSPVHSTLDHVEHRVSPVYRHELLGILYVAYLPDRLLNPVSWQDTTSHPDGNVRALEFLTLLYGALMGVWFDIEDPIDIATLYRGIETAIRERNRDALDLLLEIYENHKSSQCGSVVNQLPMEVMHQATRQGEDSVWILDTLLGFNIPTMPKDDKVLTKWALEQSEAGSRFATWLLELLRGASERDRWAVWRAKPYFLSGRVQSLAL